MKSGLWNFFIFFLYLELGLCEWNKSFGDSLTSFLSSPQESPLTQSDKPSSPPKDEKGKGRKYGMEGDTSLGTFRQLSLASTQPFIQRRLFNTSVALTVPLFSFTLPQRAIQGSSVDLANQAIFGLFSLLVTMLVFTVPVLFTGVRPIPLTGRSEGGEGASWGDQGILNHLLTSAPIFNFMGADLQHRIGLDSRKCLQKTICQAHRAPRNKDYGLLALPFQIFFPPVPKNSPVSRTTSVFQLAASEGKYSAAECGEKFRCFFDILDLAAYLIDWYKYSTEIDDNNDNPSNSMPLNAM